MNSQQVSDFYYSALNAHDAIFWNSTDSIDAHRNIAHVLRQHPGAMIGQDRLNLSAGTSAGELADYLERSAPCRVRRITNNRPAKRGFRR